MKNLISYCVVLSLCISAISCNSNKTKYEEPISKIDWSHKEINLNQKDSLIAGTSYLSVYSQIYSYTEHTSIDLTATVSMRNPNMDIQAYLLKANYFDTEGNQIHSYIDNPIALSPMETLEIVIAEFDKKGGTGGNFIFEWAIEPDSVEPIFESVMISTYGQQGLSFTTQGHRIK
ncbi:DUF3124 domain-containing protein [Maribacter cobaltidurans]|uniref:Uncharacterized protein n=1 Tax=Maribacter cobaltidurans TaxID=1178778 RepID=A0A223V1N9_9FLAO|nr:DUF3124 domain-containing protein [Maribacter cobaltidurans]ASV28938.1 hypothetical protein CJ263_01085 [Maribacter cobaltidurans]GGD73538.1 hypothetical protein GCM10011412_08990 [Maribacter cobaltidurans]